MDIDADLVRALLHEQHPHLAGEPLTRIGEGWDNVTYRVGRHYAVRIPRRQASVSLLLAEQRWLPVIAARLPIADIACAWLLFGSARGRSAFLAAYGASEAVQARAAGWAVNLVSALLDGRDPRHVEIGQMARRRLEV